MSFFSDVYKVVLGIPPGSVMTYGQIAKFLGNPRGARAVGYALRSRNAPDNLPWHRVVNSKGEISLRKTLQGDSSRTFQRILLESEGVVFDCYGRIDLSIYQLTIR